MIRFCTCTGRSASSLEQTRKQEVASSCKICGQKPLVYERGVLSGSMLSTVGLELTSVIDPDLNWTVPKTNKRATRRARASLTASNKKNLVAGSLKGSQDLIDKDLKRVEDMPVSESEKLGVSILGRRFSDAIENVPIKKRKFPLVRSPSPPPRTPPRPEESECFLKSQFISNRKKPAVSSNAEQKASIIITAGSTVLSQSEKFEDVDGEHNFSETNEKHGETADFSGISILAAAACSSNIDCTASNMEDPAVNGLLAAGEGSSRIVQNIEPCSVTEELSEKHLLNHSVLDGETDLNICIETNVEKNISMGTSKDHQNDLKSTKCPAVSIISEKSMDIIQDLPAKENETLKRIETPSSRDDRSHWDLNVVMDAWESPCGEPIVEAKSHAAFGIGEDGIKMEKVTDFEHCQVQMELGDAEDHIEMSVQNNIGGTVIVEGHDSCRGVSSTMQEMPPFSSDSPVADIVVNKNEITCISLPGIHESNEEEDHKDACTGSDSNTCSQEKIFSETDNPPNRTTGVSEETKPSHNEELISFNVDFTASAHVECEPGSASNSTCAVTEEKAVVQSVSFDGEILSSHLVVSGDTSGDHITHLHEPYDADQIADNADADGNRVAASGIDPDKQSSDQFASDAQGGKACHSRNPSPVGDHMEGNVVSEDNRSSSSVVALGNQSGDKCMAEVRRSEANCSRSPVENHVACLNTDSDKDSCQINDSFSHGAEQTSGLLADGNISKMIAVDGNAVDQSKTGDMSSHLDSSVHESLSCEELPTAGTLSQGDKAVADTREQDGKISVVIGEDINDTEMTTPVLIDPKDSAQNSANETLGMVDTPAVMGGSVSLKVCQNGVDDHAYGSGEVALEDSFNSEYDSDDVSQNDNATVLEKVSLFQTDDDSQYEDGEFRESVRHCWEEDEGEEREAEHVDYGSDNIDTDAFEPSAYNAVVDSVECKREAPSDVGHVCQEGKLDGENEKEPNCQPSLRGSLETDILPIETGERRAMKAVRRVSRGDVGKKDSDDKLDMDVKVVSELSVGGEEFVSRESRHSLITRTKSTGWDQLPDVCSSKEAVMGVRDSGIVKKHVISRLDSSHADEPLRRVFRSTSSRELSSRIEGPKCSDASFRKDKIYEDGIRSNNLDDVNPRTERDTGLGKSIGISGSSVHMRGRGRVRDHWLESSGAHWGRNRQHSPGYHGAGDHGLPGPQNAAAAAAAKLESSGFVIAPDGTIVRAGGVTPDRVRRQSANSPLRNLHHSLPRRGSSIDREGALGFVMPIGHGHVREMSPSRSISGGRGRSSRYGPRGFGTGPRERYNGPVYNDDIDSSLPMQHPLARRQRSFSPIPRRAFHRSRSRTKSPSRSRTGSPHMWTSPRGRSNSRIGRGPGLRRQLSRSPNFCTEARMRSPPRRQSFPEHMVGFAPGTRNHDSPPHTSRWIDDRRGDAPDHFRGHGYKRSSVFERSPPGRDFSRNHKFDLIESPGRTKPDDYFRSMHSGRLSEFDGVVRGRPRHDGSDDDRRKHGERYIRPYDDDVVKHFRYDVDDDFGTHHPRSKNASEFRRRGNPRDYGRGIESRLGGAPKRDGEDKVHIRYDREGKHNANFKTFGVRECDDDAAARRRRPS